MAIGGSYIWRKYDHLFAWNGSPDNWEHAPTTAGGELQAAHGLPGRCALRTGDLLPADDPADSVAERQYTNRDGHDRYRDFNGFEVDLHRSGPRITGR